MSRVPSEMQRRTEGFRDSGFVVATVVAANAGITAVFYAGIANILPRKVLEFAPPADKIVIFGAVTAVGAVVAVMTNLAAGVASDRWITRIGRRRPWAIVGLVVGSVGLVVLAEAHTLWRVLLAWGATQAGANCALVAVTAFVPDAVQSRRRGFVSGLIGLGQIAGTLGGAAAVAWAATNVREATLAVAWLYLLLLLPVTIVGTEMETKIEPANPMQDGRLFPPTAGYSDFWWAWLTRFVITLSNSIGLLYLYFYLAEVLGFPDATRRQTVLVAIAASIVLFATVLGGRISDRLARRKIPVVCSAVLLAGAQLLLALVQSWPSAVAAATLLGLGYGVYLAVDQALVTEVLPDPSRYARDLGIINVANTVPQIAAPAVATPLLASGVGYSGVYLVISVITLSGGAFIGPIRSVR